MNKLSMICIAIGTIIIVFRGPLLFAPTAVMRLSQQLVKTNIRVRLMGLFVFALCITIFMTTWDSNLFLGRLIFTLNILLVLIAIWFFLVSPQSFRLAIDLVSHIDSSVLRCFGFLAIVVGILFLYLGLAGLRSY